MGRRWSRARFVGPTPKSSSATTTSRSSSSCKVASAVPRVAGEGSRMSSPSTDGETRCLAVSSSTIVTRLGSARSEGATLTQTRKCAGSFERSLRALRSASARSSIHVPMGTASPASSTRSSSVRVSSTSGAGCRQPNSAQSPMATPVPRSTTGSYSRTRRPSSRASRRSWRFWERTATDWRIEGSKRHHDAPPSSLARRMASDASPRRVSNDGAGPGASSGEVKTTPMLADSWCSTPSTDDGRRQVLEDVGRHLAGELGRRHIRAHDDEFVAGEARHGVGLAASGQQAARGVVEKTVTDAVAEGLVDRAEVVERHDEQRKRGAVLAASRHGVLEPLLEHDAVGQVRELVAPGRLFLGAPGRREDGAEPLAEPAPTRHDGPLRLVLPPRGVVDHFNAPIPARSHRTWFHTGGLHRTDRVWRARPDIQAHPQADLQVTTRRARLVEFAGAPLTILGVPARLVRRGRVARFALSTCTVVPRRA